MDTTSNRQKIEVLQLEVNRQVTDQGKKLAERQGFEPWVPRKRNTAFPVLHIRPLCHLSVTEKQVCTISVRRATASALSVSAGTSTHETRKGTRKEKGDSRIVAPGRGNHLARPQRTRRNAGGRFLDEAIPAGGRASSRAVGDFRCRVSGEAGTDFAQVASSGELRGEDRLAEWRPRV